MQKGFDFEPIAYKKLLKIFPSYARTGSKEHNIRLCKRAIELGLKLSAAKGVMKGDVVIAGKTEQEIFDALKMDYVKPEERG